MTTVAHISDLHFGRIDPSAVESLVENLFALRPDLVVVSGDLTQRARPGQYHDARRFIDRLPIPQIIVPGNHDVPLYDFLRRLTNPYGRFHQFITADEYPEFANDDVHVVGINTACRLAPRLSGFWKDGKIRPRHLKALERIFGAVSTPPCSQGGGVQSPVRILVAHHPFIEPPGGHRHGTVQGAQPAVPMLEQLGIDLILGGHIHLSYHGDLRATYSHLQRPIVNVLAGSCTSTRRREAHHAYNVLRVDGRNVTLAVRKLIDAHWVAGDEVALALS